uniref:Uncharacterized protein n=1 Tax=Rhizophora mucronata TaxID=61149 RepID=A0A2P2QZ33_RHIMU
MYQMVLKWPRRLGQAPKNPTNNNKIENEKAHTDKSRDTK